MNQRSEKIYKQIDALVQSFKNINYGDDFDTSDTWEAARRLEDLPIFEICDNITKVEDLMCKWSLAVKITQEISEIIKVAEECAGPMVDGTKGEFCFTAALELQDLWVHICQLRCGLGPEGRENEHYINDISPEFEKCLGKYSDLSFVRSNPNAIPPIRTCAVCDGEDEKVDENEE